MSNLSFRRTRAPAVAVLALAAAALAGCGGAAAAGSHSHPAATSAATTVAERAAVPAPATKAPATKAPAPAAPKVLLSLSGSGIANSPPFLVPAETLTVHYSYSCASFGSSGNFIADLQSGNPASLGSDDQPVANVLGRALEQRPPFFPSSGSGIPVAPLIILQLLRIGHFHVHLFSPGARTRDGSRCSLATHWRIDAAGNC